MNKYLCSFPWRAAAIRPDGYTIPCCRYPRTNDPDMYINKDPRNSTHWNELRKNMLEGKLIENCISCYNDEKNGLLSIRQQSLKRLIPTTQDAIPLEELEVAFSNLCNLACVHCYRGLSTRWHAEDVKAGRIHAKSMIENDFSFELWNLSNLRSLKMIGGEPLLEQDKFCSLLERLNLQNLSVLICTNGTVLPNTRLKKLLEKCKLVKIAVSLDGLYSTNDWYRWPSKFETITHNMRIYESWWKSQNNMQFLVHSVINLINIQEIPEFIDFLKNNFSAWKVEWDWIRNPKWQHVSVLPTEIKNELLFKFEMLHKNYEVNLVIPSPYKVSVERMQQTSEIDWSIARKQIISISKERNLNSHEMLKAFQKFL